MSFEHQYGLGISKRMARQVARSFETPQRRTTTPIRTLIDATFPSLNSKQKSRWTRAIELATIVKTPPDQLTMLLKNHSGIAGCARLAADEKPRKNTYRDDWATDPTRRSASKDCDFNGFGNNA